MKSIRNFIILCSLLVLTACERKEPEPIPPLGPTYPDYPKGTPTPHLQDIDNLNQYVVKGADWKQIVQDKTQFVLGEAETESFDMYQQWPWSTAFVRYK